MNAVSLLLKENHYTNANTLIQTIGLENFLNELLESAYQEESIMHYTFVTGWLIEEETYEKHMLAINLLFHPLCHVKGAYQASVYHVKRCMYLSQQDDLYSLENLLFLNEVPDKVVTDQEAKEVALAILNINPHHKLAKQFIQHSKKGRN
ncbi:hypothetical protein [Bacillus sp. Marseille-P3800]|uniref:hypothetical protein n=1 Tax=Bacillus sp. Marseille-P3800 TaxID=2014782 RepID=UPI000C08296F|nr:hypothetical protein [Bacillus sp. Marseille-P3800]